MTCKDCYFHDLCIALGFGHESLDNAHLDCKRFKDKTKIIELPCKVGDTIFSTERGTRTEWIVFDVEYYADPNAFYVYAKNGNMFRTFDVSYSLGDTFFISREEAEKKIAERKCEK